MPRKGSYRTRRDRIVADNRYMALLDDIKKVIERGREVELWSIAQLAEEAGVSDATLRNLLSRDLEKATLDPRLATVEWLLRAVAASLNPSRDSPKPRRKRRTS